MSGKRNGTVGPKDQKHYDNRKQRHKKPRLDEVDELAAHKEEDEVVEEVVKKEKRRKIDKVKVFILDTNVLIDCPDIIYDPTDPEWRPPLNFDPPLENAHLVIPSVVQDELEGIKKGHDWRGRMAKIVLRRLAKLMPAHNGSLKTSLDLSSPIKTGLGTQTISILQLHKNFANVLPVRITNNDGWVAVTALVANLLNKDIAVDGTQTFDLDLIKSRDNYAALLTKDNGLIVKACARLGIYAYNCSFDQYPPFTGCRELIVPKEMFIYFFKHGELTEEDFLRYMPEQLPLVRNEYVIMKLKSEEDYPKNYNAHRGSFLNVSRFDGETRTLRQIQHWRGGKMPPNDGIAAYLDALNDDTIETIIATGDGGVGKTYTPLVNAIGKVENGEYERIIVITTLSSKLDCGAIPGGLLDKLAPLVSNCKDAIRSYLESTDRFEKMRQKLRKSKGSEPYYDGSTPKEGKGKKKKNGNSKGYEKNGTEKTKDRAMALSERSSYEEEISREVDNIFRRCFEIAPYETIQGRNFNDSIVFLDELQRISLQNDTNSLNSIVTMLTRSGGNSKMIITGDYSQIPKNNSEKMMLNGLYFATQLLKDSDTTAFIHLTENLRNNTTSLVFQNLAKVKEELGLY